jgi:hypothetical protein
MQKKSASMEKVEVQAKAKVEVQLSTWDPHSTSTSGCLPAVTHRLGFA